MADNFEERLTYLIRRVSTALAQNVDRALRDSSLTHAQYGALAQLGLVDPQALSAATMAERNGITAQSMSTAITGLLDRGLVRREPHPTHGRILEVRITPTGAAVLARAHAATGRAEERALAVFDEGQQRALRDALRTMMHAMGLYLYFPGAATTGAPDGERPDSATWPPEQLEQIAAADELHIAVRRTDGTLHRWTPVWVVRVGGQVYVRTWYRRDTGWFGHALRSRRVRIRVPGLEADAAVEDVGGIAGPRESIDTAYRDKYGSTGSSSMVGAAAAATTLRLSPDPSPTSEVLRPALPPRST